MSDFRLMSEYKDEYQPEDGPKRKNSSRELELLAVRTIMQTENGRTFIWRFLQSSFVFESAFDGDPLKHAYNAGYREKALWLWREVREAAPDEYLRMIQEHLNE